MQHLGRRHPDLCLPLVPDLLSTHAYFDVPEPDMDDPACILSFLNPIYQQRRDMQKTANVTAPVCHRANSMERPA